MVLKNLLTFIPKDVIYLVQDAFKNYFFKGIIIFILSSIGIVTKFIVLTQVIGFISALVFHKPYKFIIYYLDVNNYLSILIFVSAISLILIIGFLLEYFSKYLITSIACDYERICGYKFIDRVKQNQLDFASNAEGKLKEYIEIFTKSVRYCNRSMYELLAVIGPIISIIILCAYLAYSYPMLLLVSILVIISGLLSQFNIGQSAKIVSKKIQHYARVDAIDKKMFLAHLVLGNKFDLELNRFFTKCDRYIDIYKERLLITYRSIFLGSVFYMLGLCITIIIVCTDLLYNHAGSYHAIYSVLASQYMFLQARNIGKILTKMKLFSLQTQQYFSFVGGK